MFGVDDEFKGDTVELEEDHLRLTDPLDGFPLACSARTEFFLQWPLDGASNGVDDYLRFKTISFDLLALYTLYSGDLESWMACTDLEGDEQSKRKTLRRELVTCIVQSQS